MAWKSKNYSNLDYRLFKDEIMKAAQLYQVEPNLLHAIILVESNYNPKAVSAKGALGLMQLMPSTAKRFGVTDYFDPKQNIQGGAKYLAYLLKLFDNNKSLAVAAYNAGEKSVIKYGLQIPPYKETIGYVAKVNAVY
jgi:soluble lytic murein transglycosylase-like protein